MDLDKLAAEGFFDCVTDAMRPKVAKEFAKVRARYEQPTPPGTGGPVSMKPNAAAQVHHFLRMTWDTVNSGPTAEQVEAAPIAAGGLIGLMRYMVQGGATVEQIQRQFSTALEEALPPVLVEFGPGVGEATTQSRVIVPRSPTSASALNPLNVADDAITTLFKGREVVSHKLSKVMVFEGIAPIVPHHHLNVPLHNVRHPAELPLQRQDVAHERRAFQLMQGNSVQSVKQVRDELIIVDLFKVKPIRFGPSRQQDCLLTESDQRFDALNMIVTPLLSQQCASTLCVEAGNYDSHPDCHDRTDGLHPGRPVDAFVYDLDRYSHKAKLGTAGASIQ